MLKGCEMADFPCPWADLQRLFERHMVKKRLYQRGALCRAGACASLSSVWYRYTRILGFGEIDGDLEHDGQGRRRN
jgi:hypothetical protein